MDNQRPHTGAASLFTNHIHDGTVDVATDGSAVSLWRVGPRLELPVVVPEPADRRRGPIGKAILHRLDVFWKKVTRYFMEIDKLLFCSIDPGPAAKVVVPILPPIIVPAKTSAPEHLSRGSVRVIPRFKGAGSLHRLWRRSRRPLRYDGSLRRRCQPLLFCLSDITNLRWLYRRQRPSPA